MHIADKIESYFVTNNWIWARDNGAIVATKAVVFEKLAGAISDGTRIVKIKMDASGRWLEIVDGWDFVMADIDLRDYSEKTAHEAVFSEEGLCTQRIDNNSRHDNRCRWKTY